MADRRADRDHLAELVPADDGWYDDEALADLAILIRDDSF